MRLVLLSGAIAMALPPILARADEPAQPGSNVAAQIGELQQQLNELKIQQAHQREVIQQKEKQATVDGVLNDADKHSQMLDVTGISAGWNEKKKQFFIGSEDGNFYFHPIGIFQVRYNLNDREHAKKSGDGDFEQGFEIRRSKFGFDGNVFTPDLTFKLQWQDGTAGAPVLEHGWAQYVYAKNAFNIGDLAVRVGQTKDIVFKEEFTGETNQLMTERSLANNLIGGNQPPSNVLQGVDFLLLGKENPLHVEVELHNGFGGANTSFAQPHGPATTFPQIPVDPPTNAGNWGVSARADYKVFGDWADTTDLTGINNGRHDLLDIGAGVDFTDAQGAQAIRYTVDAQYQISRKLAIFAAGYGSHYEFRNLAATAPASTQNNYGGMIEGGYLIDPAWQLVARYDVVKLDSNFKVGGAGGQGTFQEAEVGVNWFGPNGSWGNHARLSTELCYLPNGVTAQSGLDYLASSKNNNEFVLRTQFQLWF